MNKAMTFKKLVIEINEAGKGYEELNRLVGLINKSFEAEKISFEDHEMLIDLAEKVCC